MGEKAAEAREAEPRLGLPPNWWWRMPAGENTGCVRVDLASRDHVGKQTRHGGVHGLPGGTLHAGACSFFS